MAKVTVSRNDEKQLDRTHFPMPVGRQNAVQREAFANRVVSKRLIVEASVGSQPSPTILPGREMRTPFFSANVDLMMAAEGEDTSNEPREIDWKLSIYLHSTCTIA